MCTAIGLGHKCCGLILLLYATGGSPHIWCYVSNSDWCCNCDFLLIGLLELNSKLDTSCMSQDDVESELTKLKYSVYDGKGSLVYKAIEAAYEEDLQVNLYIT